jgi:hypothetical protein
METHQNRKFYGKMECRPLWPTYMDEKGRTLGKTYGFKKKKRSRRKELRFLSLLQIENAHKLLGENSYYL